ncbi:MAG TPA: hypothetical protein VNU95_15990 [Candidatus Acidoferrales bacterium]|jgi:hypothetical protein|nr:hypothetical protein [Candidatus Acidoferrales bacterium]
MKKRIKLLCLALPVLINLHVFGQTTTLPAPFGSHPWTATVKVIGEDGNPITGADVDVSYDFLSASGQSGKGKSWDEIRGLTDTTGMFSVSHTDTATDLGITGKKSGYYTTHIGYQFYFDEKKWHPTFTLLLKKIGKPIPLYVKRLKAQVPILDKPVGFDLMAGDWVAPYGKGIKTDIIFNAQTEKRSEFDWDSKLTVSFPNPGDGIQEFNAPVLLQDAPMGQSDLRSSHEAPAEDYQPQWVQTISCRPHRGGYSGNRDPNHNYFIRVQTVLDENGNVKSALYGKIYGDFMDFSYYLNPAPNDRNVEFEPKHNLLGGLQSLEQVSAP